MKIEITSKALLDAEGKSDLLLDRLTDAIYANLPLHIKEHTNDYVDFIDYDKNLEICLSPDNEDEKIVGVHLRVWNVREEDWIRIQLDSDGRPLLETMNSDLTGKEYGSDDQRVIEETTSMLSQTETVKHIGRIKELMQA